MSPAPIDTTALQHLLGYALAQARVATNRAFFASVGESLQLRPVEFSLLVLLLSNEDANQRELLEALNLNAPNLTNLINKLQERGLVTRERSTTDRRAQQVQLTDDGRALALQAHDLSTRMESDIRARFSAAEWAMLLELLQRAAAR
jgi:DNA-binding MarR family transcriptional regulator